jgi:hypothetical protein
MGAEAEPNRAHAGEVLEIRVHGVNNTSPQGMLDLPETSVEEVLGDSLAGFYRPKADALKSVHEGDRGWTPPNVTCEAYSWGGLARSAPGGIGGGTLAKISATAGRIAWTLLLPFGLANVAYWTRRLDGGIPATTDGSASTPPSSPRWRSPREETRNGPGAAMIRVFGLGLTLLVLVSVCEVSMDLVGNQCFAGSTKVCGKLPGVADPLGRTSAANRLVATSLVPIALLLLFWFLAAVTRARYERATPEGPPPRGGKAEPHTPYNFLQLPRFWRGDRMVGQAAKFHLAAGFAVVALALTWPAAFGESPACGQPTDLFASACWSEVGDGGSSSWTFVVIAGLSVVVVLAAVVATWLSAQQIADVEGAAQLGQSIDDVAGEASTKTGGRLSGTLVLVAGGAVVAAAEIAMLRLHPTIGVADAAPSGKIALARPLLGVTALPVILVAILFAFALGGFMLRKMSEAWLLAVAVLLSFTVVVEQGPDGVAGPSLIVLSVAATVLVRSTRTHTAAVRFKVGRRETHFDVMPWAGAVVGLLWVFAVAVLWTETERVVIAVATAVVVLLVLVSLLVPRGGFLGGIGRLPSGDRRLIAWRGTGPGMFLSLAFLAQCALCSLVVLAAGDWLNGNKSASTLLPRAIDPQHELRTVAKPLVTDCGGLCELDDPRLVVPRPYVLMGTGIIVTLGLLLILVGAMLVFAWRAGTPPHVDPPTDAADGGEPPSSDGPGPAGVPPREDDPPNDPGINRYQIKWSSHTLNALIGARRNAAIAHRAEAALGYLAVIGITVSFGVVLVSLYPFDIWSPTSDFKPQGLWTVLQKTTNVSTIVLALLGVALLAALAGGAASANKRPLGLVWDLVCFLPRAAHPFSPPCYAERAVPELTSRIDWWLARDDAPTWVDSQRRRGERVVVSAHSLGGVISVAALLAARPNPLRYRDVALLTYGCQLRAYFSRIFPELLGHRVLGVPPARAGSFWRRDPWTKEIGGPLVGEDPIPAGSVFAMLSPAPTRPPASDVHWRNLWRRTDYLGFPVYSYLPHTETDGNPVDRLAQEVDETGYLVEVLTHGYYQRTKRYRDMLARLSALP